MDPATRVALVARADPGRVALVALVARADPGRAAPVARADTGRAAPMDLRADTVAQADQAGPAAQADPKGLAALVIQGDLQADLAGHGTGISSVATSTGPRGETDPHLGDRVYHRVRTGTGRSHRHAGNG